MKPTNPSRLTKTTQEYHIQWQAWGAALVALALLVVCLAGCAGRKRPQTFLIILMDETASFVDSGSWDLSVPVVQQALFHLRPKDRLSLVGIDHRGFDQEDVRIPVTTLSAGAFKSTTEKQALMETVRDLKPRPTSSGSRNDGGEVRGEPKGTDMLGAIDQAAHLAERNGEGFRVKLMVLSDFQDEPIEGTSGARETRRFPDGTRFKAFYVVNLPGETGKQWYERVNEWVAAFGEAGLECSASDFLDPSESVQPQVIKDFIRS